MKTREHRGSPVHDPLEAQISHEAYLLWQKEGRPVGREQEHWYAAREIVRHRQTPPVPARKVPDDEPAMAEAPGPET